MLFPTTFIFTSEKIGVGLEKQAAIFYFSFSRRWVFRYSCFDFFFNAIWGYFQLSGLWNTYLTYQIRRSATYIYVEIHKILNFRAFVPGTEIFVPKMTYEADFPFGGINPYRDKKPNCQVSDYKAWLSLMGTLVIIRMPRIWKHADFRPNQFQNIPFTYKHIPFWYKQSNTMKGFANETACINRVLICHVCIYLKLSIDQNHIKVSLYCRKNRFVTNGI